MAMRETVGSLRAYFILSGLASLFAYGRVLWVNFQGPVSIATVLWDSAVRHMTYD